MKEELEEVWKGQGHLEHKLVFGDSLDRLQQVCIQRELMIQSLLAFLSQTISQKVNVVFTKKITMVAFSISLLVNNEGPHKDRSMYVCVGELVIPTSVN